MCVNGHTVAVRIFGISPESMQIKFIIKMCIVEKIASSHECFVQCWEEEKEDWGLGSTDDGSGGGRGGNV